MSPLLTSFDLILFATCLLAPLSQNAFAAPLETLNKAVDNSDTGAVSGDDPINLDQTIHDEQLAKKNDSLVPTPAKGSPVDAPVAPASTSMTTTTAATAATTTTAATAATTTTTTTLTEAMTSSNGTIPSGYGTDILQNRGMIARMTYVLVGFSILILVYFVVKAVRLRRVKSRSRKYGVLTENLDSPLGIDDDSDEEVEVFEVNGSNMRGGRNVKGGNTAADRLLP